MSNQASPAVSALHLTKSYGSEQTSVTALAGIDVGFVRGASTAKRSVGIRKVDPDALPGRAGHAQ